MPLYYVFSPRKRWFKYKNRRRGKLEVHWGGIREGTRAVGKELVLPTQRFWEWVSTVLFAEKDGLHGFFTVWEGRWVSSVSDESSSSPGRQMSSSDGRQPCQSDTDSSVEESDFDTMPDIESDKNVIRTKVLLPGGALREGEKFRSQIQLQQHLNFLYIYFFSSGGVKFPSELFIYFV